VFVLDFFVLFYQEKGTIKVDLHEIK